MIKTAVVGLGKMGLSHLSIARATPGLDVVAVCDSSDFLPGMLSKYTGVPTYSNYRKMLDSVELDAVLIATPSGLHADMVREAITGGLHIFCEKPFCLDPDDAEKLATEALNANVVTQVGYHNRFVGAFREVKRLLDADAVGEVTHILGEAYGPVVLKPQGSTWRTNRAEGGGALYDYAAHPLNLINWYLGCPRSVGGTVLNSVFSRDTDDEVFSTLYYDGGRSAQLSVNWSDESVRKMTTRITVWGTRGRIFADRQECQVYLRERPAVPGYRQGWNVKYTTELTDPVAFYLRGEEYSAQLEEFARRVSGNQTAGVNDFTSAAVTDRTIAMMRLDAFADDLARSDSRGITSVERRAPAHPWREAAQAARTAVRTSPTLRRARSAAAAARKNLGRQVAR